MKTLAKYSLLSVAMIVMTGFVSPQWGFFGHRKINRMAIFTLPPEMSQFYKKNIEYVTEHAVDPDKRRYATKFEAYRHYIDIDHWGDNPFETVPHQWHEAQLKYSKFLVIAKGDTTEYRWSCYADSTINDVKIFDTNCDSSYAFFYQYIQPRFYDDEIVITPSELNRSLQSGFVDEKARVVFDDEFTHYGISPYHLEQYYAKLVSAFEGRNTKNILRLSTEIGHYIGDAHVPLHTTENYNGQLTNQIGIHGFWESRLPELFANNTYDFFVGKADYVADVNPYFWSVVKKSHSFLPEVLAFEKELSLTYPQDQQYCFEERLENTIQTQCEDYAAAYHTKLDGQVELRMRDAILSIGSIWYSAWIDAGQPDLNNLDAPLWSEEEFAELNKKYRSGSIKGRNHDN